MLPSCFLTCFLIRRISNHCKILSSLEIIEDDLACPQAWKWGQAEAGTAHVGKTAQVNLLLCV